MKTFFWNINTSMLVKDYEKAIYTCENADLVKAQDWQKQTIFNFGAMSYNASGKHDLAFQTIHDAIAIDTTMA